ncbi:transcriptional modulator of MazE/toxin, MazF [Desulfonatronospira thiodismutans ASO3-1]|uniref:Transcriptional modulator of MazE/toxin, MazF n=1 Tax=Desulfonatronospira thiodismutans ASO3-1 TaxID=555779 RepID=D6SRT7_9BACT|nr:type II toxin-antitoxin system PemK/MazF family toxin [Desulfonatronospira thiodismutans]EFI33403.1 transcriptional modulator of MazE/toxin, MazF [Desulfonatronospira thiodismutans ASO3-1]
MKRGQLYRVYKAPGNDPKAFRVFVVVSRQVLLDSRFSTAICAPVYSACHGLSTQVPVGIENGLKHESSIHCDELVSIPKRMLSDFIGSLSPTQMNKLDQALAIALELG